MKGYIEIKGFCDKVIAFCDKNLISVILFLQQEPKSTFH